MQICLTPASRLGEASSLTVGAFRLQLKLLCLQSVEVLIRRTFSAKVASGSNGLKGVHIVRSWAIQIFHTKWISFLAWMHLLELEGKQTGGFLNWGAYHVLGKVLIVSRTLSGMFLVRPFIRTRLTTTGTEMWIILAWKSLWMDYRRIVSTGFLNNFLKWKFSVLYRYSM